MKMKLAAIAATLLAGGLIAGPAHADLLQFSFTDGSYSASWQQSSTPTPFQIGPSDTDIVVQNGTENDAGSITAIPVVDFFINSGGFATSALIVTTGFQLFTGSLYSPTFSAGTFDLEMTGPVFNDVLGVLTVTDLTTPAVPEPSSLALLSTGLIGFAFLRRRRFQHLVGRGFARNPAIAA